ncbi:hypothetical protein D1BOALGB6SA_3396 [Olavius sp. associated proteobacterium Delta 1]|nr:hypothetical protein D1BOALGB6SA_3396 [Olavius sp. associated proteobacterium Delta 1]
MSCSPLLIFSHISGYPPLFFIHIIVTLGSAALSNPQLTTNNSQYTLS